jgi:hypothetical protein
LRTPFVLDGPPSPELAAIAAQVAAHLIPTQTESVGDSGGLGSGWLASGRAELMR